MTPYETSLMEASTKLAATLNEKIQQAVLAERERCAKIAESMGGDFIECDATGNGYREARKDIAAAIRNGNI